MDIGLQFTTYGCELGVINIYDSLPPAITSSLEHQTPQSADPTSADCGIFSLAFATAIAQGDDPSQYTFDQQKMRSHLHHCLEQVIITQFPTRWIGRKINKISHEAIIKFYCKCRMPDQAGVKMIECSRCKEWYHVGVCVDVEDDVLLKKSVKWFCQECI